MIMYVQFHCEDCDRYNYENRQKLQMHQLKTSKMESLTEASEHVLEGHEVSIRIVTEEED